MADSTMAMKFVALASACTEAEWLINLLHEIALWLKQMSPVSMM